MRPYRSGWSCENLGWMAYINSTPAQCIHLVFHLHSIQELILNWGHWAISSVSGDRSSPTSTMAVRQCDGRCAALLVLATLLGLHMPLVEGDLSQYTSSQLARWTFDGNLDDQENAGFPWHGPAVPKGSNVQLAFDNDISGEDGNGGYIKIRQPGYLNLPAVHFNEDPAFTVTFSLRIPSYPSSRQILYADWTGPHWQFLTVINPPGQISVSLRRNMTTDGSTPDQGLLDFDSGNTKIPVGAWFDVAFQFDRSTRTGKLFLDQVLVGSATVRSSLADADVVLMRSSSASYQFGRKADTDAAGLLDADLRNFRIFGTAIAN